jgi:hypothetical protein
MAIAFQFCFRISHQERPRKSRRFRMNGTHQLLVDADDVNLFEESINP